MKKEYTLADEIARRERHIAKKKWKDKREDEFAKQKLLHSKAYFHASALKQKEMRAVAMSKKLTRWMK